MRKSRVVKKLSRIPIFLPGRPPPEVTCVRAFPDPRIKAIIPIDGSNQTLKFAELTGVKVPAMGIGEEWKVLAMDPELIAAYGPAWPSWQARQHAAFSGHPSYRVDVAGAYHMTFTNVLEAGFVLRDMGLFSDEFLELWLGWYATAAATYRSAEYFDHTGSDSTETAPDHHNPPRIRA